MSFYLSVSFPEKNGYTCKKKIKGGWINEGMFSAFRLKDSSAFAVCR